jgi:hypothetical protein
MVVTSPPGAYLVEVAPVLPRVLAAELAHGLADGLDVLRVAARGTVIFNTPTPVVFLR